jgi:hypothetical protein
MPSLTNRLSCGAYDESRKGVEVELGHHGGADNGRLPVTFENFVDYGMDRHMIARAIRECVALGFLRITQAGRAGNAEFRQPNMFRLTYIHAGAEPPTHEWRKIETMQEARRLAKAAREAHSKPCKPIR